MTVIDALKVRFPGTGSLRQRVQAQVAARPLLWGALAVVLLAGIVLWGRALDGGASLPVGAAQFDLYTAQPTIAAAEVTPGPFDAGNLKGRLLG